MAFPLRPIAFVLAATHHGSMIVNRNDYHMSSPTAGYGVGFQLLSQSCFEPSEVNFILALLSCRLKYFGQGVIAIDGGANIGVHTLEWSRHMQGWGEILAFEAQERVYYALAGNIALNNCLNARAKLAALGEKCGELRVPQPNYLAPASFGSLELKQNKDNEFIGQAISYSDENCATIPMISLDSLALKRVDFIKLDVEGMEADVLRGAQKLIRQHHPIMTIETLKSDIPELEAFLLKEEYKFFHIGADMLAIHVNDPTLNHIAVANDQLTLNF